MTGIDWPCTCVHIVCMHSYKSDPLQKSHDEYGMEITIEKPKY